MLNRSAYWKGKHPLKLSHGCWTIFHINKICKGILNNYNSKEKKKNVEITIPKYTIIFDPIKSIKILREQQNFEH